MQALTKLIYDDMQPALGVTEPGAIAFAVATARGYTSGPVENVTLALNSGMYKNAFTCGIPNSSEVGNVFSAALGAVAGNAQKGLEALADVTPADNDAARALVAENRVHVQLQGVSSDIFIEACVATATDTCTVTIRHKHTNILRIVHNGKTVFEKADEEEGAAHAETAEIHAYTLAQLVQYAETVPVEEIAFIQKAYDVNNALLQEGLASPRTTFAPQLLAMNGGQVLSQDELQTAQLLCNAAIEARVIGLDKPAMSITGSGAHGIICTMPLYAVCKVRGLSDEKLLRATAISYLITMYIKEYSGRLSAFCGCGIAAGTGMACAVAWLRGGDVAAMARVINNMASSITGMICDGGNQGCTMKGIVAVDAAFRSVEFALRDTYVFNAHGINGKTPEDTMRQMGLIASPGMVGTEKTIVEIFEDKLKG